jgi:hypothetical protein
VPATIQNLIEKSIRTLSNSNKNINNVIQVNVPIEGTSLDLQDLKE